MPRAPGGCELCPEEKITFICEEGREDRVASDLEFGEVLFGLFGDPWKTRVLVSLVRN